MVDRTMNPMLGKMFQDQAQFWVLLIMMGFGYLGSLEHTLSQLKSNKLLCFCLGVLLLVSESTFWTALIGEKVAGC